MRLGGWSHTSEGLLTSVNGAGLRACEVVTKPTPHHTGPRDPFHVSESLCPAKRLENSHTFALCWEQLSYKYCHTEEGTCCFGVIGPISQLSNEA